MTPLDTNSNQDELHEIAMKFANDCGSEALGSRDFEKIKKLYIDFVLSVNAYVDTRLQTAHNSALGGVASKLKGERVEMDEMEEAYAYAAGQANGWNDYRAQVLAILEEMKS